MNDAAVKMGVHVFLGIVILFHFITRSGIAGSYSSSILIFFHNGYTNFCSHQQCASAPFLHILTNMMMMSLSMVFSLLHTPTAIVTFQCGLHFEVLSTKRSVIKLRFGCSPLKKSIFERQVLVGKEKLLSSGNQLLRVRVDSYSKINPRFSLDMKTFKGIKGKQSRLIIRVGGLDSVFFLLCVDLLIHALPLNAILPTWSTCKFVKGDTRGRKSVIPQLFNSSFLLLIIREGTHQVREGIVYIQ